MLFKLKRQSRYIQIWSSKKPALFYCVNILRNTKILCSTGSPSPPEFDPPAPHRQSVYYNAPGKTSKCASSNQYSVQLRKHIILTLSSICTVSNAAKFPLQKPRPPTPPDESPPPPEPHVTGSDGYYNEDSFKGMASWHHTYHLYSI